MEWIGVDLDGTLAVMAPEGEWSSIQRDDGAWEVGAPIMPMVKRVRRWLAAGVRIKIVTARVAAPCGHSTAMAHVGLINAWCREHLKHTLPIVAEKDLSMLVLYDDRCVQVEENTGKILGVEPTFLT